MPAALCAATLLSSLVWSAPAHADRGGVEVVNYLTTAQVVGRSGLIFMARVSRVAHVRKVVRVRGKRQRYIVNYRLQVRPERPIRGGGDRETLRRALPQLWLVAPGEPPPGTWVKRKDVYIATWQARKARVGDRIIVYLPALKAVQGEGEDMHARTAYFDLATLADRVRKLVPDALQAERLAWRKAARCKGDTWQHGGQCLTLDQVRHETRCPPLTRLKEQLVRDRPLMWCEAADGTLNGPSLSWHRNGELQERGAMSAGRRDGLWSTWWPNGKFARKINYRQGRPEGDWKEFHLNGKVAVHGRMVGGVPHGKWMRYSKAGFPLGSYRMKKGKGFVVRWYDDGIKRSEVHHIDGRPDGGARTWHPNASLESEGRHSKGARAGLWRWLNIDGGLERTRCYSAGTVLWQVVGKSPGKRRCKGR